MRKFTKEEKEELAAIAMEYAGHAKPRLPKGQVRIPTKMWNILEAFGRRDGKSAELVAQEWIDERIIAEAKAILNE